MKGHLFKERDGSTPLDFDQIKGLKFSHITTMGELDELEMRIFKEVLLGSIIKKEIIFHPRLKKTS